MKTAKEFGENLLKMLNLHNTVSICYLESEIGAYHLIEKEICSCFSEGKSNEAFSVIAHEIGHAILHKILGVFYFFTAVLCNSYITNFNSKNEVRAMRAMSIVLAAIDSWLIFLIIIFPYIWKLIDEFMASFIGIVIMQISGFKNKISITTFAYAFYTYLWYPFVLFSLFIFTKYIKMFLLWSIFFILRWIFLLISRS